MSEHSGPGQRAKSLPAAPTGHDRVDAVLARVAALDGLPVAEHPGHYEALHAALAAELDAEPGAGPAVPAPRPDTAPGEGGPERGGPR